MGFDLEHKTVKMQVGSRVKVARLDDAGKFTYSRFLGCKGIITDVDDWMYHVLLDNVEGKQVFFPGELELITTMIGGVDNIMYVPINYKYIMKRGDLTAHDKLGFIVISEETPCDFDTLCDRLGISFAYAQSIVANLLAHGLITRSKTAENMFHPVYYLDGRQNEGEKKKEPEEKTIITEDDKDVLLFVEQLEVYYSTRGVSYNISKKGRKNIKKAITYLNTVWSIRGAYDELKHFKKKEDMYLSYIISVFANLDDSILNHLKRLVHSGNKAFWRNGLKMKSKEAVGVFTPHLLSQEFAHGVYYGVKKKEIPKAPKDGGYWTTANVFLLSKWETEDYPICTQVLYALERVMIHTRYRYDPKTMADEWERLLKIHKEYVKEYKTAKRQNRLDNLLDYTKHGKKNSDFCFNCVKRGNCETYTKTALIVNCTEKLTDSK